MPNADTIPCRLVNAVVRPDREDRLRDIVRQLFERRNHSYVTGQDKMWLTVELVQSLRRKSEVYREVLSTKTKGPLPFALGHTRIRDGRLEFVTDAIPASTSPEALALLLSEFLAPGASLHVDANDGVRVWTIRDEGDVEASGGDGSGDASMRP